MIIYNVTINIDGQVHEEWLDWMKNVHIPEVMSTGYFLENRFSKVLSDDPEGITYSVQYLCNCMKDYEDYKSNHAPALQKKHTEKFANRFVAFRTLLEVVK